MRAQHILSLIRALALHGSSTIEVQLGALRTVLEYDTPLDPKLMAQWRGDHGGDPLAHALTEVLDTGAIGIACQGWIFSRTGTAPPSSHSAAANRLIVRYPWWKAVLRETPQTTVELLKRHGVFYHPSVKVDGQFIFGDGAQGWPRFHFATSQDARLLAPGLHSRRAVAVAYDGPEVGVFICLDDSECGCARFICGGVLIEERALPTAPGVNALVSVPYAERHHLDPFETLLRRVWLKALGEPWMRNDYQALDPVSNAFVWLLRHEPNTTPEESEALARLRKWKFISTLKGKRSLEQCGRVVVLQREDDYNTEKILRAAGIEFIYAADLDPKVTVKPLERRMAIGADWLSAEIDGSRVRLPIDGGWVELDLDTRSAVEKRHGQTVRFKISRVGLESREHEGDLRTRTTFWLLVSDGGNTRVYTDCDYDVFYQYNDPAGERGEEVAPRVYRIYRALTGQRTPP